MNQQGVGKLKTLSHFGLDFGAVGTVINCPEMRFIGKDHEPAFLVGPGTLEFISSTQIGYKVFGSSNDDSDTASRLIGAKLNPYDLSHQLRLVVLDLNGTEWNCGWTLPAAEGRLNGTWLLTGSTQSMTTHVTESWVSAESSVELVFNSPPPLPFGKSILSVSSIDGEEIGRRWSAAKHTVNCLGTEIVFYKKPGTDQLLVTASASLDLPHPHLENWIAEPLRILLGQPIYPRLVARNFGNGQAFMSVHPSPALLHHAGCASFMSTKPRETWRDFWSLYSQLLVTIASERRADGLRNFEANNLTRFHMEITASSSGSRWILCLTLASSIEGLVKLIMSPDERVSDFPKEELSDLRTYLTSWSGNSELKSKVVGYVGNLKQRSPGKYLRQLENRGILKREHNKAWEEVRNAVMHGNLISPWGGPTENEQIRLLAQMVQILTVQLTDKHLTKL